MAIIDCISYNGEVELLGLRLHILNEHVDEFIICESITTFSGKPKPLYFAQHRGLFSEFSHKIRYYVNYEDYTPEEIALAESSPNTKGADHWKHEFLQKERIKKALEHLNDDDIVFIGDVDEIPDFNEPVIPTTENLHRLDLKVYAYFLNNRSSESFRGVLVGRYGSIKNECLNHLRSNIIAYVEGGGWHFTSMGGYDEVKRKLSDSYTRESYWTEGVEASLKQNIDRRSDFLGRGFTYTIDESDWPEYLKKNKSRYEHLCYPTNI